MTKMPELLKWDFCTHTFKIIQVPITKFFGKTRIEVFGVCTNCLLMRPARDIRDGLFLKSFIGADGCCTVKTINDEANT